MKFFLRINKLKFIFFSILFGVSIDLILSILLPLSKEIVIENDFLEGKSLIYIFLTTVIIIPFIETLLFQFIIIEGYFIILRKNNKAIILAILTSSIVFGLSHSYSLNYILLGLIIGFYLSLIYVLAKLRKDISPFFLVSIIHMIINLMVFLLNDFLNIEL